MAVSLRVVATFAVKQLRLGIDCFSATAVLRNGPLRGRFAAALLAVPDCFSAHAGAEAGLRDRFCDRRRPGQAVLSGIDRQQGHALQWGGTAPRSRLGLRNPHYKTEGVGFEPTSAPCDAQRFSSGDPSSSDRACPSRFPPTPAPRAIDFEIVGPRLSIWAPYLLNPPPDNRQA